MSTQSFFIRPQTTTTQPSDAHANGRDTPSIQGRTLVCTHALRISDALGYPRCQAPVPDPRGTGARRGPSRAVGALKAGGCGTNSNQREQPRRSVSEPHAATAGESFYSFYSF